MKVNLTGYQGNVKKSAVVHSNDPLNPKTMVALQGVVKTFIDVQPSPHIAFRGTAENVSPASVDLVAATGQTFRVLDVESNLQGKVGYELETVREGNHYRLKVVNRLDQGNYSGYLKVRTDQPQKPEIMLRVSGFIEGEVRVQPQTLMVGRMGPQQPARTGKVRVTNNRQKPFKITKITYDRDLLEVVEEPVPNEPAYSLEIRPRIDKLAVGERRQTVVTIETDAKPSEKYEIQVHVMNAAEPQQGGGNPPTGAVKSQ